MGLSAFNAMRARMKAEAKALGKTSADVEVKEIKPAETETLVESAKEEVKDSDKELAIIKSSLEATHNRVEYVTYDDKKMVATYVRYPERSELNADINESLIVEFYNR